MKEILILVILILCIISIWLFKKAKYLAKYSTFLEDEYFNFIILLSSLSENDKIKTLEKAKHTTLYKKIRYDKADNMEKFRIMHEDNSFSQVDSNDDRPIGF